MSLSTAIQARVPASRLIQLTNLTSAPTSSINSTVLDAAIADAEAEFAVYTGVTFDESSSTHTPMGVKGALYYLIKNKNLTDEAEKLRVEWYDLMDKFAATQSTGRRWVSPGSNVPYTSTTETAGFPPDTDRSRFNDVVPRPPTSLSPTRQIDNT